jgi:hypothetical protein
MEEHREDGVALDAQNLIARSRFEPAHERARRGHLPRMEPEQPCRLGFVDVALLESIPSSPGADQKLTVGVKVSAFVLGDEIDPKIEESILVTSDRFGKTS